MILYGIFFSCHCIVPHHTISWQTRIELYNTKIICCGVMYHNMPCHIIVIYCIILYHIELNGIVPVLYFITYIIYCSVLFRIGSHGVVQYCILQGRSVLFGILYWIVSYLSYCITLYCVLLCCIVLYHSSKMLYHNMSCNDIPCRVYHVVSFHIMLCCFVSCYVLYGITKMLYCIVLYSSVQALVLYNFVSYCIIV